MIQGYYFYFQKYLHCSWISIILAYLVRFIIFCKFCMKSLICKKRIIHIPHDEAIAIISSASPDPAGQYELVQLPLNASMDLSIIVPIYNYVDLITENINSILKQKTKYQFELILVDDGSTDGSTDIIRRFENDPHIKAIYQENQGIGAARNTGLNNATGKYIMFVDCDDVVEDNLVEILMAEACSRDYDIVMCAHNLVKERDGKTYSVLPNIYPKYNLLGYIGRAEILNYAGLPWCKVFKRELFQSVRYYPGYWYEDMIIHALLFTKCKSFSYVPVVAYQYRWYEKNFSHTQGNRINSKCIDTYWLLHRILDDYFKGNNAVYNECFYTMLIKHLSAYYYPTICGLETKLIEALFSLACDLYEQFRKRKYPLPFMLRLTEKALETRNFNLWKLVCVNQ